MCETIDVLLRNQKRTNERMESLLEGFGGGSSVSPGIVTAEIKLDNWNSKKVQLRKVPDYAQSWDVILGILSTEALYITYERAGYNPIFANIDPSLFKEGNPGAIKSRSLDTMEIESGTIQFIKVSSNTGNVKMPVYNIRKDTKIVKAGDQIEGTITIVEDARKLEPRYKEIKSENVITGDLITDLQKIELVKILNKYRICITTNVSELGRTDELEMDIDIVGGTQPVSTKPYKLNANDRKALDEIITEYKREGIITETNSEYASPAFIIRKKDGSPRMVVDYRKLNKITKSINFPIPNFDDMLQKLSKAKFLITLDLALGYLQVPLSEAGKEKTAFI